HRVSLDKAALDLLDDAEDLLLLTVILDPRAVDQAARLVRLEALARVDVQERERVRGRGRALLDLDTALSGEHEQRLLRPAVEREREVVLLRDVRGALDPELAGHVAPDVEAEARVCVH